MKLTILILITIFLSFSCYEDLGNYDYDTLETISIKGINEEYVAYSRDTLKIVPEVTYSNPDADMYYFWLHESKTTGYYIKDDTAHVGLILDTIVTWRPDVEIKFMFGARNKKTGYTVYKEFSLIVVTRFMYGLYVAKDNGEHSDLDFYPLPAWLNSYSLDNLKNEISPLVDNVLEVINGVEACPRGSVQKLLYAERQPYFSYEEYRTLKLKSIYILTDEDYVMSSVETGGIFREYKDLFHTRPDVLKPMFSGVTVTDYFLINNGHLYTFFYRAGNSSGKVSYPKVLPSSGGTNSLDYSLSKYVFSECLYGTIFFDEVSSSFFRAIDGFRELMPLADGAEKAKGGVASEIPIKNNNKTLIYMGGRSSYLGNNTAPIDAPVILQDKTNTNLKILAKLWRSGNDYVSLINADTLREGTDALFNGTLITCSAPEIGLYFLSGNKVYFRETGVKNGRETSVFEAPAGETVTFIRSLYNTSNPSSDLVAIGTTLDGSQYKIRIFDKGIAGSLAADPLVLPSEGRFTTGAARDIMLMHTKLGDFRTNISW